VKKSANHHNLVPLSLQQKSKIAQRNRGYHRLQKEIFTFLPKSFAFPGLKLCWLVLLVLTNETLLPPLVLPSTSVKTRPGGRNVFSSIPGLLLAVEAVLLLVVVKRGTYLPPPPSMPPTIGRLLMGLPPFFLSFFLSSPPRPKAPNSLLTPRPPRRPLTRPPKPRALSSWPTRPSTPASRRPTAARIWNRGWVIRPHRGLSFFFA